MIRSSNQNPRQFIPIVNKITYLFSVLFLVAMLVASYTVFNAINKLYEQDQKDNFESILDLQSQKVQNEFAGIKDLVISLSKEDEVLGFLNGETEYDDVFNLFRRYNHNNKFEAVYLMDETGFTKVSTQKTFEGNNYSFRDYFIRASIENVFVTDALGITSNSLGFYFSYPVYSQDQSKFLGVVVFKANKDFIDDIILDRKNWTVSLLNSESVFIYSTDNDLVLKSLTTVARLQRLEGIEESQYLGRDIESINRKQEWYEITRANDNFITITNDFSELNGRIFLASQAIGDKDYFLVLTSPYKKLVVFDDFSVQLIPFEIFLLFVVFLIIFYVLLIKELSPMKYVIKAITKLSQGDYNYKTDVKTNDEFFVIFRLIEKVKEQVKKDFIEISIKNDNYIKESKHKIEELEKLNNLMVNREIELVKLKEELKKKENKDGG